MVLADSDDRLTIGQLARRAGVSTRTIRYYEEIGILPPPHRTDAGTRLYDRRWSFYLEGALILKALGFSLEEIRTIGRIAFGEDEPAELQVTALTLMDKKLAEVQRRLRVMNLIRDRISEVADGASPTSMLAAITIEAER